MSYEGSYNDVWNSLSLLALMCFLSGISWETEGFRGIEIGLGHVARCSVIAGSPGQIHQDVNMLYVLVMNPH